MGEINEEYIRSFIEAIEDNYRYGILGLSLMIAEYEKDNGIDAKEVKNFVVRYLNSEEDFDDFTFFQTITTYGSGYGMSAADVLDLAGLKGAYDILTSGCLPGFGRVH